MDQPTKSTLPVATPGVYVCPTSILQLLVDIKALWEEEGFGSDDDVSEPLYNRLKAAIAELQS